jgi:uncharacterized repeat protein (TIGR01451 family)
MRVLLLRIGALGAVVVLGWIAIANAQRGSSDAAADGSNAVAAGSSQLSVSSPSGDTNPLRPSPSPTTPPSAQPTPPAMPPSTPPAAESVPRRTAANPFAAQNRGNTAATVTPATALPTSSIPDASVVGLAAPPASAAATSRYRQVATPVSAEQPAAGPTLLPGGPNRSSGGREASVPDQTASRDAPRYVAVADSQEPAPFHVDPFAKPASSTPAGKADRGTADAQADSGRAGELPTEGEGTGKPGSQQLEGAQSPQLTIQKLAPKEIQVGKPAGFRIAVRNTGQIPAADVEIRDLVPKGTRLLGTTPQANRSPNGEVVWTLGTIRPGEESTVEMQLLPTAEGEIGSVANVHFSAGASVRTIATRPQLVIQTAAPNKALIGEKVMLTIRVSNPGTGMATGVVLQERIPPGLQHPAGSDLEYQVGNLKPGETRKLELPLVANRAGPTTNLLTARGDGNLRAENKLDLEVLAPKLDVVMEGPKRRYLERQATYQLSVSNPGTAPAKQVELIANLPAGLKFVRANNAGYYEESTRTVRWRLEQLPPNETGSVELVTMPVEAGQHAIKVRGVAQQGLMAEKEQPVLIEGLAAILFQVTETADPIEVGGETTYEVHVVNQGSKAAGNVRLSIALPPELKALAAEGPTRHTLEGERVVFDGLAQLAPKADTTYRLRAKALKPGDLRTRIQLLTDDMQTPVTKEESTRVYADE